MAGSEWVVENLGSDVPMHFTAFHPDWKMLDKPATPVSSLLMAREIALKNGVHYAYVGNVHHKEADSTFCHNCAGHFAAQPGDWGAKRVGVNM
jgi:pyruvate formate lyase activating enzyme